MLIIFVWSSSSIDQSLASNSHNSFFSDSEDSAESIPDNWIPLKIKGKTDELNIAPPTFPQQETTPWFDIIEIIFANISPPTTSTAPPYRPLSSGFVGSFI